MLHSCAFFGRQHMTDQKLLRELPSVDRLLGDARSAPLLARYNRAFLVRQCREVLDELRTAIRAGAALSADELGEAAVLCRVEQRIEASTPLSLCRVVNATGTILHTNLGRAALAREAVEAVALAAEYPLNLEYDLERGQRGRREHAIERQLIDLTGAEAATVVNNNAAAVLLALNTVADRREVVVSRGELIEIGGAFRIPDVMAKSGALLREVGTTNRTHLEDYEAAIGPQTALLLKVHASNYRIVGFHSEVSLAELVAAGRKRNVPVMEDLGSGALVDLGRFGLPKEPLVAERVAAGADLVTFSGDKVLGGPQAGLIVGRADVVTRIMKNPLHRALRCGKLTLAALEATLQLYQHAPDVTTSVPALRVLTRPLDEIEAMGRRVLPALQRALGPGASISLEDGTSQVGSGALPTGEIPTKVIAVRQDRMGADQIAERFRRARPPIVGRIQDDRFLLDLRTIFDPADLVPQWGE
jgi:L-seryl-tRNA(Ser) seleniumtransferase